MTLRPLVAATLLLASVAPLASQQTTPPGTRVRVSAPAIQDGVTLAHSGDWQIGTLVRIDTAAITLMVRDAEVTIPMRVVKNFEVSEGMMSTSDAWKKGARQGAIVGGGLVAAFYGLVYLVGPTEVCDEVIAPGDSCREEPLRGGEIARLVGIGAVAGSGAGVLFGSRAKERWTPITLPGMRLSVVRGSGATGLALSMRL